MVASDSFAEFLREQLEPLGRVTLRRMFGKTGAFCDGVMFGVVADNMLYLRLDDEKAGSDFNTHHSVRAARRPLDAAGQEEEEVPFEPVAGGSLSVNRDTILWIVIGVALTALLAWVFFS